MKKQMEAARMSTKQALREHKKKRLTYKERNSQQLKKGGSKIQFASMVEKASDESLLNDEED